LAPWLLGSLAPWLLGSLGFAFRYEACQITPATESRVVKR
jgi:hypothetical protein